MISRTLASPARRGNLSSTSLSDVGLRGAAIARQVDTDKATMSAKDRKIKKRVN